MSNNEPSRLDRLEALAETILLEIREVKEGLREAKEGLREAKEGLQESNKGLQESNKGLQETRAIANSNAKSIEALSNSITEQKSEWEKDRRGLYRLLSRLTRSMADFYETQSDFYNRFDQIDSRQADTAQILRELKNSKDKNQDS